MVDNPNKHCLVIGVSQLAYVVLFLNGMLYIGSSIDMIKSNDGLYLTWNSLRALVFIIAIFLWARLFRRYSKKMVLDLMIISSLTLYMFSGAAGFVVELILLIMLARLFSLLPDLYKIKTIKNISIFYLIVCGSFLALTLTGVIDAKIFAFQDIRKQSMGFVNPNTFAYFVFVSAILAYLISDRILFFLSLTLLFASFFEVGSRSFFIGGVCLLVLYAAHSIPFVFVRSVVILVVAVSIAATLSLGMITAIYPMMLVDYVYGMTGIDINILFSYRFLIMENALGQNEGVSYFFGGVPVSTDSTFSNIVLALGIVPVMLLFLVFLIRVAKMLFNNSYSELVFLLCMSVLALVEMIVDASSILSVILVCLLLFRYKLKVN